MPWVQNLLDFKDEYVEPTDEMIGVGPYKVPLSRPRFGRQIAVRQTVDIALIYDQPRLRLPSGSVIEAELSIDGWAMLLDPDGDVFELGPAEFILAKEGARDTLYLGRRN